MVKKIFLCLVISITLVFLISATFDRFQHKKLFVYKDANGVFVPSGWMGDTEAITLENRSETKPRHGKYCQKWTYDVTKSKGAGWAGVYWQYPANNWGEKRGHNLKGYSKLIFWARGEKGAEIISFKIGGVTGKYRDSITIDLGKKKLSSEWREYVIDIYGKDLSNLIGGFCWAADSKDNSKGCTFYFDDIVYE